MTGFRMSAAATLAALLLAGCGSTVKLDDTPVESRTPTPVNPGAAGGGGAAGAAGSSVPTAPQSQVGMVDLNAAANKAPAASALGRVVYFDFDSFVLRADANALLESHARVLAANKGKRLVVEGHTDERGGREYNLALGQKRAEAVVKSLALLGAAEGQLEAVSFGKERPADEGHDEDAWAKNRRAELKDR